MDTGRCQLVLLLPLLLLVSCKGVPSAEGVEDFPAMYERVTFAENVVGAVPLPRDRVGEPPTVVNWFYVGTSGQSHRVVLRQGTWDSEGQPELDERWYSVPVEQIQVVQRMDVTREVSRWVPLHEADSTYAPPAGVDTWRESVSPAEIESNDDAAPLPPGFVPDALPE